MSNPSNQILLDMCCVMRDECVLRNARDSIVGNLVTAYRSFLCTIVAIGKI